MNDKQNLQSRRSIRLSGYDYSLPGSYSITICTHKKACLFGSVISGKMELNALGTMIDSIWLQIPGHFTNLLLDGYTIMPNHFHGIVTITTENISVHPDPDTKPRRATLPEVIRRFKSISVVQHARGVRDGKWQYLVGGLWQPNYYEHIIRTEDSLNKIRQYLIENPISWEEKRQAGTRPAPTCDWSQD